MMWHHAARPILRKETFAGLQIKCHSSYRNATRSSLLLFRFSSSDWEALLEDSTLIFSKLKFNNWWLNRYYKAGTFLSLNSCSLTNDLHLDKARIIYSTGAGVDLWRKKKNEWSVWEVQSILSRPLFTPHRRLSDVLLTIWFIIISRKRKLWRQQWGRMKMTTCCESRGGGWRTRWR